MSNNPFRRKTLSTGPPLESASLNSPLPGEDQSPGGLGIANTDSAPTPGTGDQFRYQLQAHAQSTQPPPVTTFQKPKIVKKVRVQSPPPSSPESAGPTGNYPRYGLAEEDDDDSENSSSDDDDDENNDDDDDEIRDPFGNLSARTLQGTGDYLPQPAEVPVQRPPPNPFQKTLKDLEGGTKDVADTSSTTVGTPGGRATMDVDAFKRLLLTGQASGPSPHAGGPTNDGASIADTSSVSRQSLFDTAAPVQDTPRTSHEVSETEREAYKLKKVPPPVVTGRRPKPPPPSSRHGKLISVELKNRGTPMVEDPARPSSSLGTGKETTAPFPTSPSQQRALTPSDVNKPLPPAPLAHHDAESIFDREAAGKVPEMDAEPDEMSLPLARPPTPPNASHAKSSPAPAVPHAPVKPTPPPRRQPHGRSDSKLSITGIPPPVPSVPLHPDEIEPSPRRSSQESIRSRSSSLRVGVLAPAPPPPRRSTHGPPRPSNNSFVSPSTISFSSVTSAVGEQSPSDPAAELSPFPSQHPTPLEAPTVETSVSPGTEAMPSYLGHHSNNSHSKLIPPPPPPARNASVRSKRPPSVSSLDATSRRVMQHTSSMGPPPPPPPSRQRGSSRGSIDGVPRRTSVDSVRVLPGTLAEEPTSLAPPPPPPGASANDILADLTALQREVDALRGRYEKEKGV